MIPSDLNDISDRAETVVIGGKEVQVVGIPMYMIAEINADSPEVIGLLFGAGLDVAALATKGPALAARMISAGVGNPDDKETIEWARKRPLDTQIKLLTGTIKATLGGGGGPFVQMVTELRAAGTMEEKVKPMRLRMVQTESLQSSSSLSPEAAIPQKKFGT